VRSEALKQKNQIQEDDIGDLKQQMTEVRQRLDSVANDVLDSVANDVLKLKMNVTAPKPESSNRKLHIVIDVSVLVGVLIGVLLGVVVALIVR